MKQLFRIAIWPMLLFFASCEDTIDVKVNNSEGILVVEGWLTNKRDTQYVKLYTTKSLSDEETYPPVSGAEVVLHDDLNHQEKLQEVSPGSYAITAIKGMVGATYTLTIKTAVGDYEAVSTMPRPGFLPDSLSFNYKGGSASVDQTGYYPFLSGQEVEGQGDYFQVRIYRNNEFLNHTGDLNIFSDKYIDGYYLKDIQLHIDSPFVKGDVVKAEVWSLNEDAYYFWTDIKSQLQNDQIFASPLTNPRNNIRKLTSESKEVTGFFGTSIVWSLQRTVR